jgi:uncharacterized membrane protein YedE/YeeE
MNQNKEHLRLLAIFHYVVAGLAALFSFFPLLYSTIGGFMLYVAHQPGPTNQEPPPAIVGWIFVALGALFFFAGLAMAICILMAGRSLARQRRLSVRVRHRMSRMFLYSLRDNSWGVYDYCALTRIGEDVVFNPREGALLKFEPRSRWPPSDPTSK